MLKTVFCCRLEEDADRADRVAAIAEEEAKRFNHSSYYLFLRCSFSVLLGNIFLRWELFCFTVNYYFHKILKPFTASTLILRLEAEIVEKRLLMLPWRERRRSWTKIELINLSIH